MPSFNKPCLDCGVLTKQTRCEKCGGLYLKKNPRQKKMTPEKKARHSALYGTKEYKQARRILKATATHCHLCGEPFTPTDRIEADHLIPGHPGSPLAPAHRRCNQSRGNKTLEQWTPPRK